MDDIYYAFVALLEAKQTRDKAKKKYTGYSWGYAGYEYEKSVDEAKQRFTEAFDERVRYVIQQGNIAGVS